MNPLRLARAAAASIDKPAFTRADLVEAIAPVLPVVIEGAPGTPRTLIEAIVDRVGMRITAATHVQRSGRVPNGSPPRKSSPKRLRVIGLIDTRERPIAVLPGEDRGGSRSSRGIVPGSGSGDHRHRVTSPWLIQPLSAPAGAGKTTSLTALRSAANTAGKRVLVLAPTGQATDVAVREGAGDDGFTVAKALTSLRDEHVDPGFVHRGGGG